jgi:hypothetical protein
VRRVKTCSFQLDFPIRPTLNLDQMREEPEMVKGAPDTAHGRKRIGWRSLCGVTAWGSGETSCYWLKALLLPLNYNVV